MNWGKERKKDEGIRQIRKQEREQREGRCVDGWMKRMINRRDGGGLDMASR